MGQHTAIEWADSSLNLMMGCEGCELWNPKAGVRRCYAGTLTARHAGKKGWPAAFDQPRIFPERLQKALRWPDLTGKDRPDKPWLNGYPRVIFLNDMGDTFTESLDLFWMDPFIPAMAESPHIYIFLTKRPQWAAAYFWGRIHVKHFSGDGKSIPPNFWLLTSVTGPENVGRIRELLKLRQLGARVLGVSYEPAWGPVDFRPWLGRVFGEGGNVLPPPDGMSYRDPVWNDLRLDWVVAGGESGAGAKPSHPARFRAARDACQAAGVAFFFKQWGEFAPWKDLHGPITAGQETVNVVDPEEGGARMTRLDKHAAGAVLDGREWREMPERKR